MSINNWLKGYPLLHASCINKTVFAMAVTSALSLPNAMAAPAVWTQPVNGGEMLFYDWGYSGPQGQNAGQWVSNGTFDGAAQIQHVVTRSADRLTPDAPMLIRTDLDTTPLFRDANMDTQVNFYQWGYTTKAGSTFSNMQIDADGDYLIKRSDMTFNYYNTFDYQYEGAEPIENLVLNAAEGVSDTNIQFQPYALSDARGWCGSITASNPGALEAMAGQVTFDFGFEAFMPAAPHDGNGVGIPGMGSMQIVQDFEMRSYGSLQILISAANGGQGDFDFNADAVVNNTHPTAATGTGTMISVPVLNMDGTPVLDEFNQPRTMMVEDKTVGGGGVDGSFYNLVSFMGGGTVPLGVWVEKVDPAGPSSNDNLVRVVDAAEVVDVNSDNVDDTNPNIVWHQNSFAGYPFLLRADGIRVIEAMNYTLYSDLSNVPNVSGGVAYNNDENSVSQPVADITGTPDAFAFNDQINVEPDTLISSNTISITGLARETVIAISGGEYSINAGAFTSARGVIVNNDTVQVRATSSAAHLTAVDATLSIGSVSDTFSVTTRDIDTTPDSFGFTDQSIVELNTVITSNAITVSGIEAPTSISVSNGAYSINGSGYTSIAGTVSNGDLVTVRHTSAANQSTMVITTLTIGGISDGFSSVTKDITPNAFSFTDMVDAQLNMLFADMGTGISGINAPTPISITGGQYAINGGSLTSANGTVNAGDIIDVYVQSANAGSTTTSATVTIGGVSDTFSVTTGSDADNDGIIDIMDNCTLVANADQFDTDGDNYGNACDADFNNDGIVNSLDTGTFKAAFYTTGTVETDINSDGIVNSLDLGLYKQKILLAPGPSGLVP